MRCFYHQEKEAVGFCRSCEKAVCAECAVDLGKGLACRNKCEADARAVIQLVERSLRAHAAPEVIIAPVQKVLPAGQSAPPAQSTDHLAMQLAGNARQTRRVWGGLAIFNFIVGGSLLVTGLSGGALLLDFLGLCFVIFGGVCAVEAQHARMPTLPETKTR